ncbi:MAG: CHAD domain-containing protein [Gemmatimonadaceae bacterium]
MEDRTRQRAAEPASLGARRYALGLVDAIEGANQRRGSSDDSEALHDMRVALRRLRSWLRAMQAAVPEVNKKPRRRLDRIAESSNASRDAEVLLEWLQARTPALRPRHRTAARQLAASMQERKAAADTRLERKVERRLESTLRTLRRRLARYAAPVHPGGSVDPSFGATLAHVILAQERALGLALSEIASVADDKRIHRARIRAKRLRYALESIMDVSDDARALVQSLKGLQDSLGDVHDAHVWSRELAGALERAAEEDASAISALARAPSAPPVAGQRRAPRRRSVTRMRPGLVALAEGVREHAERAFSHVQSDWLGEAAEPFFERTRSLAAGLEGVVRRDVEIERKYLLYALPKLPQATLEEIAQGYLPGERLIERVRRVAANGSTRFFRTVKAGSGITRLEIEEETTQPVFDQLWPLTQGKRVVKRRHVVTTPEHTFEIDEFLDRQLVLAEVELPEPDADVTIPEWLEPAIDREVTGEPEFLNVNLAR